MAEVTKSIIEVGLTLLGFTIELELMSEIAIQMNHYLLAIVSALLVW